MRCYSPTTQDWNSVFWGYLSEQHVQHRSEKACSPYIFLTAVFEENGELVDGQSLDDIQVDKAGDGVRAAEKLFETQKPCKIV